MSAGDGSNRFHLDGYCESLALLAEHLGSILPCCLFILDRNYTIIVANDRGKTLLSRASGLSETKGRLLAQRASVDRSLKEMILKTIDGGPAPGVQHIGIPDREGVTRYLVRLHPLTVESERLAALLVIDLHARELPSPDVLVRIFGYSVREAEFAAFFAAGLTLDEVSQAMQITLHTARIHLRRVFAKTGCIGQAQLARVLARVF
ncbi:MAG: hypothetical protein JWN07_316 [Hyphomicrobiales bacterium]|nr:hypothetical protein [Hyphomicrobiales bacterium]